jgi:hypothetical protein
MRKHLLVLMATSLLVVACSSPENSQEYQDLEQVVADLEGQIEDLSAKVESARQTAEATETDFQTLLDLRADAAGLRDDIALMEADEDSLTAQVADLGLQLDAAIEGSTAFRRWVADQNELDERWDCAESIAFFFVSWGGDKVTPDLLMDPPPAESNLLRAGREQLALLPGDGCDDWYPAAKGAPWTAGKVFDAVCAPVDTAALQDSPEDVAGNCLTGWGHVTLFDQQGEPCRLEADIGPTNVSPWQYELWVEFKDPSQFDCEWLFGLDVGDEFRWWAIADETSIATDDEGAEATIPTFNILRFVYWYRA